MAAESLAAVTGRHGALHIPSTADDISYRRFVAWWKMLVRESTTAKRAPPPREESVDLLIIGVLALLFVLAVW